MDEALPAYARRLGPGRYEVLVWVQPGARESRTDGVHDGRLKLKVRAPAVDGKANAALLELVADVLGVKRNAVAIRHGDAGRRKTLNVTSETPPRWPVA
jgi:uncharacterized protein